MPSNKWPAWETMQAFVLAGMRRKSVARKQFQFIADKNVGAAISQLDEIERQTDSLVDQPEFGRPGRIDGTGELVISHTFFIVIFAKKSNRWGNLGASYTAHGMAA
ncbi:type II toxin-antitoxin system RelE/ParE family toxin [Rhizobium leguminosarum]|uniref:type II toxin-antitoxin system RelE/ParE family toxin n=1 Tax=Rhizobium leguminosarum TaxID=384 RepID=UPI001FE04B22|nr:type II toxin-antitoxin system RelE/ParE family toxin [Rhizobium leguminosarum]